MDSADGKVKSKVKSMMRPSMTSQSRICSNINRIVSASLDGELPAAEREHFDRHVMRCADCAGRLKEMGKLRSTLRTLPSRVPPAGLTMELRVVASHEASHRRKTATWAARWKEWLSDTRLWMNNLLRPLAIPTAGGVCSAVFLFTAISPILVVPCVSASPDIPTGLYTEASVKSAVGLVFPREEIVVELTVDERGKMVDYSFPFREDLSRSPVLLRRIENSLLFTHFTPATTFGQPKAGKIRISFRSSQIEVKG